MTTILLCGYKGKMGIAVTNEISKNNNNLTLIGYDKGEAIPCCNADIFIDFSSKENVLQNIKYSSEHKIPYLTGVTGFSENELAEIKSYSQFIPVFLDYNMSIGINFILSILHNFTNKLSDYDIEITETHHNQKKDAPSGTAIKIFNALNRENKYSMKCGREGIGLRDKKEIGINSVRLGGVFGEHSIRFGNEFEEVCLSHRAYSRETFAKGVVKAALWLINKEKGFYSMKDLFA